MRTEKKKVPYYDLDVHMLITSENMLSRNTDFIVTINFISPVTNIELQKEVIKKISNILKI